MPLIGTLNKPKTRAQIKQDLASLNGTVNLTGKVDKKDMVTSVQQATQQAQKKVNAQPVEINFSVKKDKLVNDIKLLGRQNSKLFKDVGMSQKYTQLLDSAQLANSTKELNNLRLQLGAFRSELKVTGNAGLTWEDIDMKNRIITIDHQLQYKKLGDEKFDFHITPTKNTHTRKIPMTDDVYDVLSELHKYFFILRKDYCVDDKKDFLFYSKSGRLLNIGTFNYELKKAVEKYNETAEYKIDKISAHTLRHTGCTRDAEDGMDIKVLQYLMGHSNTQITNNVYNHVNEERAANEVASVAERRRNRA